MIKNKYVIPSDGGCYTAFKTRRQCEERWITGTSTSTSSNVRHNDAITCLCVRGDLVVTGSLDRFVHAFKLGTEIFSLKVGMVASVDVNNVGIICVGLYSGYDFYEKMIRCLQQIS